MPHSAVKAELSPIVIRDGTIVTVISPAQRLDRGDGFLRSDHQDDHITYLPLGQALEVFLDRFKSVSKPAFRYPRSGRSRLGLGVGLGHLGRHEILRAEKLQ